MGNVLKLTKDVYGTFVIRTAIEHCDLSTVELIIAEMKGHFLELSKDQYGFFVIRIAIEYCD